MSLPGTLAATGPGGGFVVGCHAGAAPSPVGALDRPGGMPLPGGLVKVGPDGAQAGVPEPLKPLPGPPHAGPPGPSGAFVGPPHADTPGPRGIPWPPPHGGAGLVDGGSLVGPPQADVPVAAGGLAGPPSGRVEAELGVRVVGKFLDADPAQAEFDWPGKDGEPKVKLLQPPKRRVSVRAMEVARQRGAVSPCRSRSEAARVTGVEIVAEKGRRVAERW